MSLIPETIREKKCLLIEKLFYWIVFFARALSVVVVQPERLYDTKLITVLWLSGIFFSFFSRENVVFAC
jgi:hypothetical protein